MSNNTNEMSGLQTSADEGSAITDKMSHLPLCWLWPSKIWGPKSTKGSSEWAKCHVWHVAT